MSPTVLLTLGRLPKALDIARSFSANGWRVIVAEPFRRHLLGASRSVANSHRVTAPTVSKAQYLGELERIVQDEDVSLVVPISEETMHISFLRSSLPAHVALFTMPSEQLLAVYNKKTFVERARGFGLTVPETAVLGTAEAEELVGSGPCVIKPVHSCSGRGLAFVNRGGALPIAPSDNRSIVQRQIEGEEFSTCSIAHGGEVVSTVVYRGLQRSGRVAVVFERVEYPAIGEWVRQFVAATGWTGFISFDVIVDKHGTPWAIECNPRTTSGLHFWKMEEIARAVVEPGWQPAFRPELRLQQFYSALTETQMSLFRRGPFWENLQALVGTRDVTWNVKDPLPFLTMTWTSWEIIQLAMARKATFGEVATIDVGWYEDWST